jgi:hypothetical protein
MGMANFNKNLFVGTGGVDAINISHFIGAVCGMENLMGRGHNPLLSILSHCSEKYLCALDLWYVLTFMGASYNEEMEMKRNDDAYDLSLMVHFNTLERTRRRLWFI